MTLHCLYHATDTPAAERLLADLQGAHPGNDANNDAVLLLSEAVSLARASHPALNDWLSLGVPLYALREDIQAYGVTPLHASVEAIDYAHWVTLSEQYATQMLWR